MSVAGPLGDRPTRRQGGSLGQRQRILVTNHTPVHGSGSGTYSAEVARGLARAGHHVVVFSPGPVASHHDAQGVIWVQGTVRDDRRFPTYTGHPESSLTYDALSGEELADYRNSLATALGTIVKRERIDLVHAQHLGLLAVEAASTGARVVVTSHGSELGLLARARDTRWAELHQLARLLAPRTVSVSEAVRSTIQAIFGPDITLGPVIGNGFDPLIFSGTGGTPHRLRPSATVVIGGRMVAYKRFDLALAGLAGARDLTGIEIDVDVVGDGPLRADVEAWASASRLPHRFAGLLDQRELAGLLRGAQLFVSTAIDEPFGLLALEAAGTGCPVVIPRRSGLAEMLSSASGRLVDGVEPGTWARAIACELGMARSRRAVSRGVASFTWDAVVEQLLDHDGRTFDP